MYAGWIPGKPEDRRKWRWLGIRGSMRWIQETDPDQLIKHPEWTGHFEHCEASPSVMQRLLNDPRIDLPDTFTAYWIETGDNLPCGRQLWGGASVQQ